MFQSATSPRFSGVLGRFRDNRSGVAAVEFALIAPMMFLLLFMSFEMTNAVAANRRAETAASSLADVISRDVLVTDDEIEGIFNAVSWITYPTEAARVQSRVTSVFIDEDGRAEVQWSEGSGMAPLDAGAVIGIPNGMRVPNTGLVIGETILDYDPPLGLFSSVPMTFAKTEYRRPRVIDPVMRD
jgi:Flp pilus assembly protein TadG